MNQIVYRPGDWQVVVEESGVIAVPADAATDRVAQLSALLQDDAPALTRVIDVLSGGSITDLGSFAVALTGADGIRFAVRGAVDVRLAGGEPFSGADVTTWSERYVAGSRAFEIVLDGSSARAPYPIRSGVVLAGAVACGDVDAIGADAEQSVTDAGAPVADAPAAESPVTAEPADAADGPAASGEEQADPADGQSANGLSADEPSADELAVQHTLIPTDLTYAPEEPEPSLDGDADADGGGDADAGSEPAPVTAPASAADAAAAHDTAAADDATVVAPPAPAVVPPPAVLPPPAAGLGDHDGATISLAEARRLRAERSAAPDAPTEVLPAVDAPAAAATGRIRLSTGQVLELDRTVIIGRRPRSTRASGATMPHLVAVESPQQDISRSHLEIRPEGDSVVVIDLHTTNGSTLLRPGADPVRLHPGEQTLVLDGDTVDLGDGVTVRFEGLT